MDRELVGKYKKYLEDIQTATTISVASMLTIDPTTDELQDHISVLDQGMDKSTNMWLEFLFMIKVLQLFRSQLLLKKILRSSLHL